ncbi:MAG: hypothetical protein HPY76_07170 [Anaerolineae bacterium]|jgi:hypothetical protein|nr:hypothetical protein [Anaerolineae bacterium]
MRDQQYYQIQLQKTLNAIIPRYPELFLRAYYFRRFRKILPLEHPRSFNEKLQWLKIFGNTEAHRHLVDKVSAKEHVREILGDSYIIQNYQIIEDARQIDFDALPERFVAKPNHLSGRVFISRDRDSLDRTELIDKINYWSQLDYYYVWFESSYKGIQPRIIFEELLSDGHETMRDYKFYCFDGRVEYAHVDLDRFIKHMRIMFSREWEALPFSFNFPICDVAIPQPDNLAEMIEIAETLSRGFPFVRIDLYQSSRGIKFSEFTFFPEAGLGRFTPPEWDAKFGELLQLPANAA